MHYFTSITACYWPKARVLARSVKRHDPGAVFHLVLSDKVPEGIDLTSEPFDSVIPLEELGIPNLASWTFMHTVVELCTAVKGRAFEKIFESTDAEKVVYFDPDIVVLYALEELSDILAKASIVLTPHLVEPDLTDDAIRDNEICSLKHGVFNLGFLAVRRTEEGLRFVRWWRDRLLDYCYDDIPQGLFTDQKWVDLAPAFFDEIYIVRDKAYNVATWNLSHRKVHVGRDGVLRIDNSPIKFFHYSGFDSGAQEIMLKKYGGDNKALFDFRAWYEAELYREGQEVLGTLPCTHSFYSNGEVIPDAHRLLYRSRPDLIKAFPHPTVVLEDKPCYYLWVKHTAPQEYPVQETTVLSRNEQALANAIVRSRAWRGARWARSLADLVKLKLS